MYSPSPTPVVASNAYMYLNHQQQQQLASNPYATRPQAHHVNGMTASPSVDDPTMINASVNGTPNAVQNNVANAPMGNVPPAAFAYNQLPQYGTPNRHDNPNSNWIGRYPSRPNPMNPLASNPPLISSVPPAMGHVMNNSLTGSPAYGTTTGLTSSPHTGSMMSTRVSPVPPTTLQSNSLSTSSVNGASSSEWQHQIYCAEISRQSYSPHHHARAAALAARSSIHANQDPKRAIQLPASAAANGLSFPLSNDSNRNSSAENHLGSIPASPAKLPGLRTPSSSSKDSKENDKQSWTTIDMGGLSLKNIGPEVFRYTFLTSLFINHNQLTTLPQCIVQLRNLSILDASANKLVMIPPELGLLSELRAVFLFDNCLTVLPPELGSLYQLELLGLEGNPLQEDLMGMIQRDGTQALIAFLRDSCPVSVPPPEREWIAIDAKVAPEKEDPNNTFLVLSYNVLCEKYATPQMYGYTPRWALMWEYRKEFILQEITSYGADICCLQEVEMGQYEDFFEPKMQQSDYQGLFWPKSRARTMRDDERKHVDGCATFFNSRVYRLVDKQLIEFNQIALQRPDFKKTEDIFNRVMTKDNVAAIAMLEHRVTGAKLLVANAHMHWDPEFRDVKLVQSAMLMEQLEILGDRFAKLAPQTSLDSNTKPPSYRNGKQIPMVICGDFNSTPDSGVYEFLSQGSAMATHHDFMDYKYGTYTSEGLRHGYQLRSAYNSIGELPTTNWTPGFRGAIDYIWYSSNTLANSGLLGEVDPGYLSRVVGFPNAHFPSDHICILAEFKIKPPESES